MKRVETVLSTQQYAEVVDFCEKHGLSVYALLKRAVLDYIGLKTLPPETSEMTDSEASIARVAERLSTIPKEGIDLLLRIIDTMLEIPPAEMVRILQTAKEEKSKRSGDMEKVPLQR
ncbi:MAG: hypothetical protein KAU99_03265 [Thermoplasmata archaeon]|nr:hypothetical protein [Thermoplasmata archaeon]